MMKTLAFTVVAVLTIEAFGATPVPIKNQAEKSAQERRCSESDDFAICFSSRQVKIESGETFALSSIPRVVSVDIAVGEEYQFGLQTDEAKKMVWESSEPKIVSTTRKMKNITSVRIVCPIAKESEYRLTCSKENAGGKREVVGTITVVVNRTTALDADRIDRISARGSGSSRIDEGECGPIQRILRTIFGGSTNCVSAIQRWLNGTDRNPASTVLVVFLAVCALPLIVFLFLLAEHRELRRPSKAVAVQGALAGVANAILAMFQLEGGAGEFLSLLVLVFLGISLICSLAGGTSAEGGKGFKVFSVFMLAALSLASMVVTMFVFAIAVIILIIVAVGGALLGGAKESLKSGGSSVPSGPRTARLDDGTEIEEHGTSWYEKGGCGSYRDNGDGTFTRTN